MNRADKWEEITLVNSKCSEGSLEPHSQIYRAVLKNMKDHQCHLHAEEYQYYYWGRLMCLHCFTEATAVAGKADASGLRQKYQYFYHLETILNHPIVLAIDESELISHPIELMELTLTSYKQIYHKKQQFKLQRQLIDDFVVRVKSRINQLCDQIVANFTRVQSEGSNPGGIKEELKDLGTMYEEQLMSMLGQKYVEGRKEELQLILQEYAASNENPLPRMLANLEEMMASLTATPYIDLSLLTEVYTTVTDQKLWNPSKIISTLSSNYPKADTPQLILNTQAIHLQNQYTLSLSETQLSLKVDGHCNLGNKLQLQIDSLYALPHYQLLGVSYDQLTVISYFDQLTVEEEYLVSGCTDILPFRDRMVVISNDELVVLTRKTKRRVVLGTNFKNLKYCAEDQTSFSCENEDEETVVWRGSAVFQNRAVDN